MFVGKGIWKISVPSSQFCCEPKTALNVFLIKFLKVYLLSMHGI